METATIEKTVTAEPVEAAVPVIGTEKKLFYRFVKRFFDITLSFLGLAVLFVPMLIIAIAIPLDSKGSAIFTQKRMGKDGKIFTMYKFRTMSPDAPAEMAARDFHDAEDYMTKLGWFLRRTSIDELPQLINILRGDMSIVGYRPVCLTETQLNELRMRYGVFTVRPGITGLAQVSGRDNIEYKEKALLDAKYVAERSLKMDLWCLLQTVRVVVTGEGVM